MSVSKSVTALLAGALEGAGLLDPSAPVTRYIPEADGSAFGDAQVRHLLDMTTATAFVEDYSPGEDVRRYRQSTGWYPAETGAPGLHDYLLTIRKAAEHGPKFHYVSPNTDMLGWVCERAADLTYAEALSAYIWAPLGAESDADVTVDRLGAMRAAGGISMVPRDLARIGQLIVEDGLGIVPEAYSPLGTGRHLSHPVVARIAERVGRTPAQVLLRWCIQLGLPVIPKSTHRERIEENGRIFDFELSPEDMEQLAALDETGGTDLAREEVWW